MNRNKVANLLYGEELDRERRVVATQRRVRPEALRGREECPTGAVVGYNARISE